MTTGDRLILRFYLPQYCPLTIAPPLATVPRCGLCGGTHAGRAA